MEGEVIFGDDALKAFSYDASILSRRPQAVVYARHVNDVRRCLLFLSQLAAKGGDVSVTVRGGGSDLSGAALTSGIILLMPPYMNKLLPGNARKALYRAQAGLQVGQLKTLLADLDVFLPALGNLPVTATLGGAVANNAFAAYSNKYGSMEQSLKSLKVVLANGEEIEVRPLSQQQVKDKMTLATFEGDIYRQLSLLFLNDDAPYHFQKSPIFQKDHSSSSLAGYNLTSLCPPRGGLNLLPLFAGSQGTLGVITEVEFQAQPLNKSPQAVVLSCQQFKSCLRAAADISELRPAALSFISTSCFKSLRSSASFILVDFEELFNCEVLLIAEFDDLNKKKLERRIKETVEIAQGLGIESRSFKTAASYAALERLRTSLNLIPANDRGLARHIWGGFRGAYVPLEKWSTFYNQAQLLFAGYSLDFLALGEITCGHFSVLPKFNLQTSHHQKRFLKFLSLYADLVLQHDGRLSFERQEGALLGQFLKSAAEDNYELLQIIKKTFDPQGVLNPDIKVGARRDDVAQHLVSSPTWDSFYHQGFRLN